MICSIVKHVWLWLQGDDTCNLFIWDENIKQGKNVYEFINEDGRKIKELDVVKILKKLSESSKKKNKKLQKKLNSQAFAGKLKLICFIFGYMINIYLMMKCKVY